MTDPEKFGTLEKQDVRDCWPDEARHFTPWLAKNIDLLGEVLGLDGLEAVEEESSVGGFSVDLLCKDQHDQTVIIENQLGKTDHRHLGQLLTYAAGKKAVVVVWVSTEFTNEHRAALDWLNEKTDEGVQFFGAQVEVWKIGDSRTAPKFDLVCKPNEWSKIAQHSKDLSDLQKMRLEFWTGLSDRMSAESSRVNPVTPKTGHWMSFTIGKTGFYMNALFNLPADSVSVQFIINRDRATTKKFFDLLKKEKEEIEKEVGEKLEWRKLKTKRQSQVNLHRSDCNLKDTENWQMLQEWINENLEKFHAAFHERIQNLRIEDWQPSDADDSEEGED
ncbi:MAG: DUF4268 domain-containing protein [Gammaproteobacteria bacterium]|nr:DUF4268 domain-containing protein [Gammaproteobacteria bacterium]CAJ2377120.1 MAG: conserved hypothetical protein [Arenicellales bacterium IbO2]MDA7962330.1 DUF4268 domain-containing protein [Gammaproteobacteria bacterium]MDA7970146.1 DUF4268 domain-containing protein [Gammaproteobacteria bacterium]MDA7972495.1 DUF4268 domain-containing protein [Gammaproteobacteria bacterium]